MSAELYSLIIILTSSQIPICVSDIAQNIISYNPKYRNTKSGNGESIKPGRNDLIDEVFHMGLFDTEELLMAGPQIEQQPERRQPHLVLREAQLNDAVIKEPGKQLIVCYPATVFFPSSSLSTLRLVPRIMAFMIASLYSARS